jgi:hypothetical protein
VGGQLRRVFRCSRRAGSLTSGVVGGGWGVVGGAAVVRAPSHLGWAGAAVMRGPLAPEVDCRGSNVTLSDDIVVIRRALR